MRGALPLHVWRASYVESADKALVSAMEVNLLTTTHVLKHPVLATARAAGRATRVGQNSAFLLVKQALRAATLTNELVVSSVKLLNPLRWAKRSVDRCRSSKCEPTRTAPLLRDRRSAAPARKAEKGAVSELQDAGIPRAKVVAEPRIRPSHRKAQMPRPRPTRLRRAAPPQGITPEEISAAVFAGVTEKVMFTRAHKDLASQNPATRARAAHKMGGIGHELSARALSVRLALDPSAEVRKECVNGLTALGMKEHLPAVERALSDRSSAVRLAAVRSIHRLAGPEGAASLVRMFSDKDEDVRRRAAACLGWLGQKHLAVELLPLLRGGSASVRLAALEALGNLKSPATAAEVIELLDDPEEAVQRKASQVLQTITGKQMGETFPRDEDGRRFLIARWRAWQEKKPLRQGS